MDSPPTNASGFSEFAFLIPSEKFVYQRNGAWALAELVGKEGIRNHLLELGWDELMVATTLRDRTYLRVYGAELVPNEPPVFAGRDGKLYLNTWSAPTLKPVPDAEFPSVEAVLDWVTKGDAEGKRWLTHWMALKIQNPGMVPKVAVVLATEQGGGKGTLAYVMRHMLGWSNTAVIKREELENRFNSRWIDKLFVLADEVISNENVRDISNLLKVLIDGGEVELEGKGTNQRAITNRLAWMFASNDAVSPVALERSDRRYSVFANHDPLPPSYVATLNGCFEVDRSAPTAAFIREMGGFLAHLQALEVDRGFVSRPYQNESRSLLIEANTSPHELFCTYVDEHGIDELLEHVLRHGDFSLNNNRNHWDFGPNGIATQVLYRCYVEYCRRIGARPLKLNRFGVAVRGHRPEWPSARPTIPGTDRRVNVYVVTRSPNPTTNPPTPKAEP